MPEIKVPRFKTELGFETSPERSLLMSKIRGKGTKPEIGFRKLLWAHGIRYRINYKKLPGAPDIFIKKYKLIIFIDGEFWHGYKWEQKKERIKTNKIYWTLKIESNIQRDSTNNRILQAAGYTVVRFWEHEITKNIGKCFSLVLKIIEADSK